MTEAERSASEARYRMLDLLRGVTVFLMIAAHAVYFFHNDTSSILSLVEKFGNTVAFTTFLIISGATAKIAYFSKEDIWPERKKRLYKRIRVLLLGYFVIAFIVFFGDIASSQGIAKLAFILDILTLRKMPPFGEFYLPFIVFPFIISLLPRFFRKVTKSLFMTILVSLAIYFLGMLLYQLPVPEILVPWKGMLVGAEGYYRFPIFQYFPLYLLGMVWKTKLLILKTKQQVELAEGVMLTSGLSLVFAIVTFLVFGSSMEEIMRRWPPSIPFLMVGIFFASVLALFFYASHQLRKVPLLRDGILVLGQNALGLALTHIFLLQIYTLAGGTRTGSITLYIIGLVILMVLSIALAAIVPFNFRFALSLERGSYREDEVEQETLVKFEEEATEYFEKDVSRLKKYFFIRRFHGRGDERLIKRRHILGVSFLLAAAGFIVFPPIAEEYQMRQTSKEGTPWYDESFGWRQSMAIKNNESLAEIPKGNIVKFYINHAQLVTAKKSLPDGSDIRIQYWNGEKYEDTEHSFSSSPNQATTAISVALKDRLKSGAENRSYYLYYGNNVVESSGQKELKNPSQLKYSVTFGGEEAHPLLLSVDRRWTLISKNPAIPKNLRVTLQTTQDYATEEAKYVVEGEGMTGKLEKTGEKQWEGVIEAAQLNPGKYQLSAIIADNQGKNLTSSGTGFYVSHPLYIAWTQDWEGYDVPDVYLAAITQVARDHGLVMTHFWNPRLLTTETVADGRKDKLLDWLKTRSSVFGESVQLHLHMFNDFVTASGVTPKSSPNWGDSGDGYGSLTTNYTTDEMVKIINKGLEIMRKNGFSPTIFRAGGWFANEATLKAVQDSGLLADSSGRTSYKFFSQPGPWDLSATAQPYYPSTNDQNKAGEPSLSILEIPNNGADSYWFSSEEMQKRFRANYGGGILTEPKEITYLSHPHWFNKSEQNKIKELFNLIDNYKYENDFGPALYVTLDEVYEVWKK